MIICQSTAKERCLQGHDESSCWNIRLELHEKKLEEKEEFSKKQSEGGNMEHKEGTNKNNLRGEKFNK